MELSRFGALPNGGVNRQALSEEEIQTRAQRLRGDDPGLAPVLIGSHIDSQPTGGKFDGAYGVLAALESVEAIVAAGLKPRRNIDVVAWMNEEESRFAPGMMGSAVFAGARKIEDVLVVRAGITVEAALKKVLGAAPRLPQRQLGAIPAAFLEAHTEQGPLLEADNQKVEIVTGIQEKRTYRVKVDGEENHAGTSPRSVRRDALVSAISILNALHKVMWDEQDIVRFTVGMFNVAPNAPSVVPSQVLFSIDLRHLDAATLRELGDMIAPICAREKLRCNAEVTELLHDPPLAFPADIRATLKSIAEALAIPNMEMASGAGHDARYLHYVCPTGMIFIPCKNGISHSEEESITKEDQQFSF